MRIFVDSDACPVKEEAIRVATRHGLPVTLVSNQGMRPVRAEHVTQVVVSAAFDAADDWIIEHAQAGDIVITGDIPLAARALDKGCKALNHKGRLFTGQNIGAILAMRELNSHLRETGENSGFNPGFTKKDRSQFLQSLELLIQQGK